MNEPRPIPAEDLALYAMQALSADEMVAVAAALRDNAQAQKELAEIQGDLALLALSSDQHGTPAGSFERLKARMHESGNAAAAPAPPAPAARTSMVELRRRSKWTIITPWAIAAALAIACSTLGYRDSALNDALDDQVKLSANLAARASHAQQVLEVLNAPDAQRVTLTTSKTPPAPTAHAVYLAERGALVMEASNLKAVPAGKAYELWVLPANGTAPVAAGTFAPDARGFASVVLPSLKTGIMAKGFAVTVEKAEGSPVPTSPVVLSGE